MMMMITMITSLWLKGYYREMMAASTLSDTKDSADSDDSVYNKYLIAVAVTVVCVAAVSIVGIVAFVIWRIRHKRNNTRRRQSEYFLNFLFFYHLCRPTLIILIVLGHVARQIFTVSNTMV